MNEMSVRVELITIWAREKFKNENVKQTFSPQICRYDTLLRSNVA